MAATVRLRVIYGTFPIYDDDDGPTAVDESTGLVFTWETGAVVLTGLDTGTVEVAAQPLAQSPGEPGKEFLQEWEDVAEVDVVSTSGSLWVGSYNSDEEVDLPDLALAGPGRYRLRVHAWGRDLQYQKILVDSPERFLLQCWPVTRASPAIIIKATDAAGRINREAAMQSKQEG